MRETLEIRNTKKYKGDCKHLDDWTFVCYAQFEYHKSKWNDSGDSGKLSIDIHVNAKVKVMRIEQAIKDTLTTRGCSCEHDCCGCVSQVVNTVTKTGARTWRAELSLSRNI